LFSNFIHITLAILAQEILATLIDTPTHTPQAYSNTQVDLPVHV